MKYNYKRPRHKCNMELAREICKKMGIEWSKTAESPTLRGVPITGEYFGDIFRGKTTTIDKEESV